MKTEQKIIKLLLTDREPKTIRDISKGIKADYKITHTAVKILAKKGLITEKHIGNSILVLLNKQISKELFIAEYERKEDVQKSGDIRIIPEILAKSIKTGFYTILLFGSQAKGTATNRSDIDIMIIIPKISQKEAERAIRLLPNRIHPTVLSEDEFVDMKESKEPNVVHEALNSYVILYGIEQFYTIIKK